jgi:acyl-CoA hydrolase
VVCPVLWGDEFGLDFAHLNPAIELHHMCYTNNPRIIAQHEFRDHLQQEARKLFWP